MPGILLRIFIIASQVHKKALENILQLESTHFPYSYYFLFPFLQTPQPLLFFLHPSLLLGLPISRHGMNISLNHIKSLISFLEGYLIQVWKFLEFQEWILRRVRFGEASVLSRYIAIQSTPKSGASILFRESDLFQLVELWVVILFPMEKTVAFEGGVFGIIPFWHPSPPQTQPSSDFPTKIYRNFPTWN